jgi:pimeloyl-ACP methyl ester carboxylesterase
VAESAPVTPQPPPRPPAWQEPFSAALFFVMGPRLPRVTEPDPPDGLRPWETVAVERDGAGPLSGTWYPAAPGSERGAVLLLHPWVEWGKSYFHRRGRIQALRAAGYHALAVDLGGFGGARRHGYLDGDVEAALKFLRQRAGALPIHVWGVSAGGYWAHFALSRQTGIFGAVFEDVSPHLIEWSWRMAPWGRPAFLFYRKVLRTAYRFLDIRRHAPAMSLAAVSYVSGAQDPGVRPEDTQALATAAGGRALIVPRADHLGSIKVANDEVIALALETFHRAELR